jgi:N-acetylglucosamine kinase-like BadF-type ATPase
MTRQRLANLAPLVFASAATDAAAAKVVSAAADDLAELVATLAGRLGFQPGEFMLALTGGVFLHQPAYRTDVVARLGRRGMAPQSVTLVESPAAGAVALARQALRSS